jgi:hypothetical protein
MNLEGSLSTGCRKDLSKYQYAWFCQYQMAVDGPIHHSAKKATTQPKKVLIFTMKLWKLALSAQISLKKPPLQQSWAEPGVCKTFAILKMQLTPDVFCKYLSKVPRFTSGR